MKRWLSGVAVVVCALATVRTACAQDALSVTIVGRGDDGFKELSAQFEKNTGRKVALRFPSFIESRDTIVKGEPFDVGIVEFPHDADVIASGNVVPGSATLIANGWLAVAVKQGAPKPDISTPEKLKAALLSARRIAFSDPARGATAGTHFLKVIESLGIKDEVLKKATLAQDGVETMRLVLEGQVDLGVTQTSEIVQANRAALVGPFPKEFELATTYSLWHRASASAAAKGFAALLTSPAGRARLAEDGVRPPAAR